MSVEEFINSVSKIDLTKVGYRKLQALIDNSEIQLPYTTSMIQKGAIIERGRLNKVNSFYSSEFEISYRTDFGNIKDFGRANQPYTSRFYGAFISKEIPFARVVLFSELENKFINIPQENYDVTMTIGQWLVKENFEVADVCFSENYNSVNEIRDKYKYWQEKIKDTEIGQEKFLKLLHFFSGQFSKKKINSHHDYKLSTLYTDYAIHNLNLNGVIYPSVRTDYRGNNIVLTNHAVEKYLELKKVGMFKYEVKANKPILRPTFYSENLGPFNSIFSWEPIKIILNNE